MCAVVLWSLLVLVLVLVLVLLLFPLGEDTWDETCVPRRVHATTGGGVRRGWPTTVSTAHSTGGVVVSSGVVIER